MFHRVCDAPPTSFNVPDCWRLRGTRVTCEELVARVAGRQVVALHDVVDALRDDQTPPAGVVLTFDDGYAEWVDVALALSARGWPATFFWSAAMHADGPLHPIDEYYSILDRATRPRFDVELPDGTRFSGDLTTLTGKSALVCSGPKPFIIDPNTAQAMLEAVAVALDVERDHGPARELYLSDGQRAEIESLGHEFGAHGLTHVRLSDLDEAAVATEVAGSRAWLGERTRWFAYPDGDFDLRVVAAVRSAGYDAAVTCLPGSVHARADRFQLPRSNALVKSESPDLKAQ